MKYFTEHGTFAREYKNALNKIVNWDELEKLLRDPEISLTEVRLLGYEIASDIRLHTLGVFLMRQFDAVDKE